MPRFVLVFLSGTALHFLARPYVGPIVNRVLNAKVAAYLIDLVTPGETIRQVGSSIVSSRAAVEVAQGCEGVDVALMVAAAVLAFPMSPQRKLLGILAGTALIYVSNLVRIAGLWYCVRFYPSIFDFMHTIVGQTLIILIGVVFVGYWTGALRAAPNPAAQTA